MTSEIDSFRQLLNNLLHEGNCELYRTKTYRQIVTDILLSERTPCHGFLEYALFKDLFPVFKKRWEYASDFTNSKIITSDEIYDDNKIVNQLNQLSYSPKISPLKDLSPVSFLRFKNAYMFYAPDQECFIYCLNAKNCKEHSEFYDKMGLYFNLLDKMSYPFKERKIASHSSINIENPNTGYLRQYEE